MDSRPIGVFDSGVGGLTVVKELMKRLPNEGIIYFGDTARVPYGTKSKETVVRFNLENTLFLLKQDVKMIVVACNTSSSFALAQIKRYFKIPLIGVIKPGAKKAVNATRNKRIAVLGTRATINSNAYEKEIKALDPGIKIFTQSCPLFVPLVEEGIFEGKIAADIVKMYLEKLKKERVDTMILGCTHYPLLKGEISRVMGSSVTLVDSAREITEEVKEILEEERILSNKKCRKNIFYVTDQPQNFIKTAKLFLGKSLGEVKRVPNV